jgi:hypothetical protein
LVAAKVGEPKACAFASSRNGNVAARAIDLKKGGTAIPYHEEDPYVRAEFEAALKASITNSMRAPEVA